VIEKGSYQLGFELDLPDDDDSAGGPDARLLLETARSAFEEKQEKPDWFEEYEALIRGGWPFRVAMYIAWAASPKNGRRPDTIHELANLMGLTSPRAIYTWRSRNQAIDAQVAILQAAPLFKHRADVIQALVDSASTDSYRNNPDRRLFFQLTGELSEDVNLNVSGAKQDLRNLSDEELAILAGHLGVEDITHPEAEDEDA
jgi:hypothetical protein